MAPRPLLLWLMVLIGLSAPAVLAQGWDPYFAYIVTCDGVGYNQEGEAFEEGIDMPSIDAIGRFVAFCRIYPEPDDPEESRPATEIWVRDRGASRSYLMTLSVGTEPVDGIEADGDSIHPAISADARFVAYLSFATDLVVGDTNGLVDVFVSAVPLGPTERVSVSSFGQQADRDCFDPKISADGRFVTFYSAATNLVFGDNNGVKDVFLRDRLLRTTELISVNSEGVPGNGPSVDAELSADGRYVVFSSEASNLVPGDTNHVADIFVRDREAGTTERITYSNWGEQTDQGSMAPAISGNGNVVAYISWATNLVPGDTNNIEDLFVYERGARTTERINISPLSMESTGECSNPQVSFTGRFVAFEYDAADLWPLSWTYPLPEPRQVYLRDRARETTSLIPLWCYEDDQGNWHVEIPDAQSWGASMSRGAEYVAFATFAGNLHDEFRGNPDPDNPAPVVLVREVMDYRIFSDVPTYYWAFNEILALLQYRVSYGYDDGSFRPADIVTRDAMAVFLARTLCGSDANVPIGPLTPSFPDVPIDHWAYNYIEYMKAHGVAGGYPDGLYHPEIEVDRASMAAFMARAMTGGDAGIPPPPANPTFTDVTATDPIWGWSTPFSSPPYCSPGQGIKPRFAAFAFG